MEKVAVIPYLMYTSTPHLQTDMKRLWDGMDSVDFISRDVAEEYAVNGKRNRQLVAQIMIFSVPKHVYENIQNEEANDDEIIQNTKMITSIRLGGDERLKGTTAAAFGGHVEESDCFHRGLPLSVEESLRKTAQRELTEELYAKKYEGVWLKLLDNALIPRGIICLDISEVESLHIGVVYALAIPDWIPLGVLESEVLEISSVLISSFPDFLKQDNQMIDNWSKIMLSAPTSSYSDIIRQSVLSG
jgi:predicted NUDIX family phosphoesterase